MYTHCAICTVQVMLAQVQYSLFPGVHVGRIDKFPEFRAIPDNITSRCDCSQ